LYTKKGYVKRKNQGWSKDVIKMFNNIYQAVKDNRDAPHCMAVEEEYLDYISETRKDDEESKKKKATEHGCMVLPMTLCC